MPSSRERRERDAEASPFAFLRFWHTDEADVARELKEYDSLSPLQSARGRSALLAVALGVLSLVAGLARADVLGAVTGALIWLAAGWRTAAVDTRRTGSSLGSRSSGDARE